MGTVRESGVVADQVTATLDEGGKAGAALRVALAKTALNADELAAELDAHAPHSSASLKAEVEEKLASHSERRMRRSPKRLQRSH